MRRTLIAVLALSAALSGCKAKEAMDKAAIADDLSKRGTMDLLKQTAEDKYTPPPDGRLTESQIQMYLKVRDHEKQIAQVALQQAREHSDAAKKAGDKSFSGMMEGFKTLGSAADIATADIRAAKDLHYNTREYLWVKGQILAASAAAFAEKSTRALNATVDASVQQMKKAYAEARDEQTRKLYADMLASYDKQNQEMQQKTAEEPSLAYNRQLLAKYDDALNALANELGKYEDKPGEAQKSVEQWSRDVDKAAQDAKKGQ